MTEFVVTTTVDVVAADGETSLREAIVAANASNDIDTITFAPALSGQTVVLSEGVLAITTGGALTIDGDLDNDGNHDITIDANESATIFTVSLSSIVTLDGLHIREGDGVLANGLAVGAIYNAGQLTIMNSYFAGNGGQATAAGGHAAGILNAGTMSIVNTQIYYGHLIAASGAGGGAGYVTVHGGQGGSAAQILNLAGGILTLSNVVGGYGQLYAGDGGAGGITLGGPGGNGGDGGSAAAIVNLGTMSGDAVVLGANTFDEAGSGGAGGVGSPNGAAGADGHHVLGILGIGTAGDDTHDGIAGAETWFGRGGNDQVTTGDGNDFAAGEAGNDTLTGSGGDTLQGGAGNDVIVNSFVDGGAFTGGDGFDTLDLSQDPDVTGTYDLSAPSFSTSFGGSFSGFEAVLGGASAETLIGSADGNILDGGAGADTIAGGGGNDLIEGGAGNDTLNGGAGADTFRIRGAGTGVDRITGFNIEEDGFDLGDGAAFLSFSELNGTTTLVHAGGQIRVVGVTGLTLEQWNARTWHIVSDYRAITNGNDTWSGYDSVGLPAFVTFSFEQELEPDNGFTQEQRDGWEPLDETERDYARAVFEAMDDASGLTFFEVPAGEGDIRLGAIPQTESLAFAFGPNFMVVPGLQYSAPLAGDVFGMADFDNYAGIFWHEIGHAIGFGHVYEGYYRLGPDLTYDPFGTTIMHAGGDLVQSLKALDIAAIQYFYGTDATDGTQVSSWNFDETTHTLTQTGFATADRMRGTFGRDVMFGIGGADIVFGDGGNDTLSGGAAGDTVNGGLGRDLVAGDGGADSLFGEIGNDTLQGGEGADTLDGGAGADSMLGGAGSDLYFVDARGDQTIETLAGAAGGNDLVISSISRRLGANLERLILNDAAVNGIGNDLGNAISGNGLGNKLQGFAGNDTLTGNDGDDQLLGGIGNDSMIGGAGHDRYFLDSANDATVEFFGQGIDTVYSQISHTLRANIENLRLQTTADLIGNGNELNNKIYGNTGANRLQGFAGADTLEGKNGADTLVGGEGNDTLTGGSHADIFRFATTSAGADRITDFNKNADRFELSGGSFSALNIVGADTILTHNGGTIRMVGVSNLTLAQWNALVIPTSMARDDAGGYTIGLHAAPAFHEALARLQQDMIQIHHGEWIFA